MANSDNNKGNLWITVVVIVALAIIGVVIWKMIAA